MCYTVDPNEYTHKIDLKGELSIAFFIHYNEDRQMEDIDDTENYNVIIETIGKVIIIVELLLLMLLIFTEPLELSLDKKYFLNVIKEITVTDSFLSMNKNEKGCQEESFNECATRKYKKTVLNKCQCLPFQMIQSKKVGNMWQVKDSI